MSLQLSGHDFRAKPREPLCQIICGTNHGFKPLLSKWKWNAECLSPGCHIRRNARAVEKSVLLPNHLGRSYETRTRPEKD